MIVGDEGDNTQWLLSKPHERCDIEGFEDRIHGDAIAGSESTSKVHRAAVDEQEINLYVRYPQRLDRILDGRRAIEGIRDSPPPAPKRDQII